MIKRYLILENCCCARTLFIAFGRLSMAKLRHSSILYPSIYLLGLQFYEFFFIIVYRHCTFVHMFWAQCRDFDKQQFTFDNNGLSVIQNCPDWNLQIATCVHNELSEGKYLIQKFSYPSNHKSKTLRFLFLVMH
jgi:hypothetical protein